MKKKIMSALILIVFFGGILGAVIFKDIDQRITVIFVGGVFFFVGLLCIIDNKLTFKNAPLLIFCIVGVIMAGIPLWLILGEKYPDSVPPLTDDLINEIAGLICIIVGVSIAVFPTLAEIHKKRVCTERVTAKCIDVKSHYVSGKNGMRRVYSPVWEFEFYGKLYVADENNYSSNRNFEVDDIQEIFINPLDPQEIYRKVSGTIISAMIFGLVFVAFGIWMFCL